MATRDQVIAAEDVSSRAAGAIQTIVSAALVVALAGTLIANGAGRFEQLSDLRGRNGAMTAAVATMVPPLAAGFALDVQSLTDILRAAY